MFFHEQIDEQIKHNEKRTKELDLKLENLNREVNKFLNELPIAVEQLNTFLESPTNFSEDEWKGLQELKTLLDEKLQKQLQQIRDPLKTKKAYEERNVQRHWLFVR